jgi:hypothetical protein
MKNNILLSFISTEIIMSITNICKKCKELIAKEHGQYFIDGDHICLQCYEQKIKIASSKDIVNQGLTEGEQDKLLDEFRRFQKYFSSEKNEK